MENEMLVLVDSADNEIGYETKKKCHYRHPILHRAFSVFIFNDKNEMLLAKRSSLKKTWPSHWSNTVCSHPRKGERIEDAVKRRLAEELGIKCQTRFLFKFEYAAQFNEEWGERELDWVFAGRFSGGVTPDKGEVEDWKFVSAQKLRRDIESNPDNYTPWFKMCIDKVLEEAKKVL